MNDIIVVIPSYKPNETIMAKFINELKREFKNIIIVNDGSGKKYDDFFSSFEKDGIKLIKHHVNLGKGRAIKTAFNYICNNFPEFKSIVTADCDGQHAVKDIKKCGQASIKNPSSLVLGVRDFNQDDVPFKSRYGNKITKSVFKMFIGLDISDTQTGLRGFSKKLVEHFLTTTGERYEYETNMLIDCKTHDISIKEVKIKTIYIDDNGTSHFNPIRDSIAIYKLFVKYIFSSISSFIVDITFFTLFVSLLKNSIGDRILIATIMARVISSLYNFFVNGKLIFKKANKTSLFKYAFLVVVQMFVSGYTVSYLSGLLPISFILIKVIVDTIIFIINFIIQRDWVFKNKK